MIGFQPDQAEILAQRRELAAQCIRRMPEREKRRACEQLRRNMQSPELSAELRGHLAILLGMVEGGD